MVRHMVIGSIVLAAALLAGCSRERDAGSETSVPDAAGAKYILAAEPAGAQGAIELRKSAKNGDAVTVVGRIGGDVNPWIEGKAGFLIVDLSIKSCAETGDDACSTPWDYCCSDPTLLATGIVSIKIVDESGETVRTDARKLLALKELNVVVVKGKVDRDDKGKFVVLATGLYRRADPKK